MGFIRSGHGGSAAHAAVIEIPPLDEIGGASANAAATADGLAVRAVRGKPFTPGNAAAHGRPPSLARLGVELDAASPGYRAAMKRASRFVQHRRREYSVAGGGHVSAGVCALLASSGRALAASVLLSEMAGRLLTSTNAKAQRQAALLLVQSARLGSEARMAEVSALAVHERETKARADANATEDMTWLTGKPAPAKKVATSASAIEGVRSVGLPRDLSPPSVVDSGGAVVAASVMSEAERSDAEADACDPDDPEDGAS